MRLSQLKHPLAVLRTTLKKGQKDFAEMIGKSAATVQAIELGKLQLSEKLAAEIAKQTGVNPLWLLAGDPAKPMTNREGGEYTMFDYINAVAAETEKEYEEPDEEDNYPDDLKDQMGWVMCIQMGASHGYDIAEILAAAREKGDLQIVSARLYVLLEEFGKKYGNPPKKFLDFERRTKVTYKFPTGDIYCRNDELLDDEGNPVTLDDLDEVAGEKGEKISEMKKLKRQLRSKRRRNS